MPRVLIDATALPEYRGGVGRYVDELVARLPHQGCDLVVVAQPRDREIYARLLPPSRVVVAPGWAEHPAPRLAWEQTGLAALTRQLRPDVLHSPHYTMPVAATPNSRTAQVVTLHDATFFSDPELHLGAKSRFFRTWTRLSVRRADRLIVPSVATKEEVLAYTACDPDKIAVVPHGVDHGRFRPPTDNEVEHARKWLGLRPHEAYLAFLGTLEPRKNVPSLVRAYGTACAAMQDPPPLVLAGARGWDTTIDPEIARLPNRLRVVRPGFVPDRFVPGLLGGAEVVAYPAFGEGFGLPVLEAMACGAAVLTTRRLSLPEVGGDAVAYADTPAPRDITAALVTLLADPERRAMLGAAGIRRAAGFTWDRTARGHLLAYQEVVREVRTKVTGQ